MLKVSAWTDVKVNVCGALLSVPVRAVWQQVCLKHLFPVGEQVEEHRTGALLLEDGDEESGQSDDEDEARLQIQVPREAAWVDEDDDLEEE